ncbi:membrane dipeptidase [Kwoniella mangroviensis CBS 10435]|uniref:Dipeptidase n=1 Tax=Kwoniella mangroviensis CBS 10435 TaxID=1331196 RepID=A0A1B9IML5_9TREE|nr:membrane dipeptidase [Kwoniella mangroviensis CBS 10435]
MSSQPLLPHDRLDPSSPPRRKLILTTILIPILLIGGIIFVSIKGDGVPKDNLGLARYYLKGSPVIDGHIDLPEFARAFYGNNISAFDLNKPTKGHVDIPRIREGSLGAFFWSIFVECRDDNGKDFLNPTFQVRDTLEQIDVSFNLIEKYSDTFAFASTADEVEVAIKEGKVASMFGLEGGHMLGNSLAVLRTFHKLGVRYMTLTHSCNNAFADSAGIFESVEERWGGLSKFGRALVPEMNRLGVIVDLSHVSDKTALQALSITRAPVMLSHSAARHFNNMSRNVPDNILSKIGRGKNQVDGVVMVNFFPVFASANPDEVDVSYIADEIEYIVEKTGKHHVGIGSDYDGIETTPKGLEDVSKYPYLFAELIKRGWTEHELSLLAGGNFLRVFRGVEEVSRKLKNDGWKPSLTIYEKRRDLDPVEWEL